MTWNNLLRSDRTLTCLPELFNRAWIASKILLAAHKDDREASTEVKDLGDPLGSLLYQHPESFQLVVYLLLDVVERIGRVNGKANDDDVCTGVTEWTEAVVVFHTCSIPYCQLDMLSIDFNICDVVLKDGRNKCLRSRVWSGQ
jgi:hypothetical protein